MKKFNLLNLIIVATVILLLSTNCEKDKSELSTVKTYIPKYIASTSVTIGCIVESDGGSGIADCGVYFSSSQNPETSGTKFKIGNDTGLFLAQITGLLPNTQYYVMAYAINTKGETLGEQLNFTTTGKITDNDNNSYETVKIGGQLWMAENLRTTHYLNGDLIETTTPATLDISSEGEPKYQWAYDGNDSNVATYGRLYTWYAVTDSRKVCPTGWHVPSDTEWTTLITDLGGGGIAGGKLKERGTTHWQSPNAGATNESIFTALAGGSRGDDFGDLGLLGIWWSSTEFSATEANLIVIVNYAPEVGKFHESKKIGVSVRCLAD